MQDWPVGIFDLVQCLFQHIPDQFEDGLPGCLVGNDFAVMEVHDRRKVELFRAQHRDEDATGREHEHEPRHARRLAFAEINHLPQAKRFHAFGQRFVLFVGIPQVSSKS